MKSTFTRVAEWSEQVVSAQMCVEFMKDHAKGDLEIIRMAESAMRKFQRLETTINELKVEHLAGVGLIQLNDLMDEADKLLDQITAFLNSRKAG